MLHQCVTNCVCALLKDLISVSFEEVVKTYTIRSLLHISSVCPVNTELFIGCCL